MNLAVTQLDPVAAGVFGGFNNPMTPYLGPNMAPPMSNPFEKRSRDVYTFPDAKAGQYEQIADTIADLIFSDHEYMTSVILPWRETNTVNLSTTKFESQPFLMRNTPALVAGRLMTQRKSTRTYTIHRKKIGFKWEHDFIRSPEGRVSFLAYMAQTKRSMQTTAELTGIQALLHASATEDAFLQQNTHIGDKTIRDYLRADRDRFALAQKDEHGLEILSTEINTELDRYNGRADTFIMPQCMADYVEFAPERTNFYKSGLPITQTVEKPHPVENALPTRFIKDAGVYLTRSKYVEGLAGGMSDPLGQPRQNGSYNTMRLREDEDWDNYDSDSRNRQIYDEDIDDWQTITLEQALENSHLFDERTGDMTLPGGKEQRRRSGKEDDFDVDPFVLKMEDGTRMAAQYFGDMAADFLDARTVLNCARTLKAALRREMGETAFEAAEAAVNKLTEEAWVDNSEPAALANALASILGDNNAYAPNIPGSIAERYYYSLFLYNVVPVLRNGDSITSDQLKERLAPIEAKFLHNITVVAPSGKKDEIDALAKNPDKLPVLELGERIKAQLKTYIGMKLGKGEAFKKFKTEEDVEKWYEPRVNNYKENVAKVKIDASASGGGAAVVAGYRPAGQDLSGTGFSYKYKASAYHNDHPMAVIPTFREMMDRQTEESGPGDAAPASRIRDDGVGMGFSGIGRVVIDRNRADERRKTREKGLLGEFYRERYRNFGYRVNDVIASLPSSKNLDRALALAILGVRLNKTDLMRLIRRNVAVPIDFILARPHQSRHTQALIKCAAFGQTGFTYYTLPNFEIGHDAATGQSIAQFNMTFDPVIHAPQNNYVQRSVYADDYYGGCGSEFWTPEQYRAINWNGDIDKSIICIAIPVTEKRIGDKDNNTLDLKGYFGADYLRGIENTTASGVQLDKDGFHYSTYYRYNQLYDFDHMSKHGSARPDHIHSKRHINLICEPAAQRRFNPKTRTWSEPSTNRDHWGAIVGPGCADIRRGKKRYVRGMRFVKY